VDLRVGTTCALAVLVALYHHQRTGEGQYVDLSSTEVVSALVGGVFMEYSMNRRVPGRDGNWDRTMAPHNCYPCQPGEGGSIAGEGSQRWVSIAVGSDEEWRALCSVLGEGGLEEDPRFADVVSRWRHREELDDIVSAWTRSRTAEEATETLQKAGVAAMPVLDGAALAQDPHLRERGALEKVEHPVIGSRLALAPPWRLSDTPAAIRGPSPCLGEHNGYVLGQLLGIPDEEIEELARDGVVA
jgi:benzylsuccinate CoA-transferase BbsF subunit